MASKTFYKRIEGADYRSLKEGIVILFSEGGRVAEATMSGIQYGLNSEAGLKVSFSSENRVLWNQPVWIEQKKGLSLDQVRIDILQMELVNQKNEIDSIKRKMAKLLEAVKLVGSIKSSKQ